MNFKDIKNDVKNIDKDQILEMLGLEEKSSTTSALLQSLGLIGLGAIVGAGLTLLFAPTSGRQLRGDIGRRLKNGTDDVMDMARDKLDHARTAGA